MQEDNPLSTAEALLILTPAHNYRQDDQSGSFQLKPRRLSQPGSGMKLGFRFFVPPPRTDALLLRRLGQWLTGLHHPDMTSVSPEGIADLCKVITTRRFGSNSTIVANGVTAAYVIILLEGSVELCGEEGETEEDPDNAVKNRKKLVTVEDNLLLGKIDVRDPKGKYTFQATANSSCSVLMIPKQQWLNVSACPTEVNSDKMDMVRRLFPRWGRTKLLKFAACLRETSFSAKQVIYRQNDFPASHVYFVKDGWALAKWMPEPHREYLYELNSARLEKELIERDKMKEEQERVKKMYTKDMPLLAGFASDTDGVGQWRSKRLKEPEEKLGDRLTEPTSVKHTELRPFDTFVGKIHQKTPRYFQVKIDAQSLGGGLGLRLHLRPGSHGGEAVVSRAHKYPTSSHCEWSVVASSPNQPAVLTIGGAETTTTTVGVNESAQHLTDGTYYIGIHSPLVTMTPETFGLKLEMVNNGEPLPWSRKPGAKARRSPSFNLAYLGSGQLFGASSVLKSCPYNATVVAQSKMTVFSMDHDSFIANVRGDTRRQLLDMGDDQERQRAKLLESQQSLRQYLSGIVPEQEDTAIDKLQGSEGLRRLGEGKFVPVGSRKPKPKKFGFQGSTHSPPKVLDEHLIPVQTISCAARTLAPKVVSPEEILARKVALDLKKQARRVTARVEAVLEAEDRKYESTKRAVETNSSLLVEEDLDELLQSSDISLPSFKASLDRHLEERATKSNRMLLNLLEEELAQREAAGMVAISTELPAPGSVLEAILLDRGVPLSEIWLKPSFYRATDIQNSLREERKRQKERVGEDLEVVSADDVQITNPWISLDALSNILKQNVDASEIHGKSKEEVFEAARVHHLTKLVEHTHTEHPKPLEIENVAQFSVMHPLPLPDPGPLPPNKRRDSDVENTALIRKQEQEMRARTKFKLATQESICRDLQKPSRLEGFRVQQVELERAKLEFRENFLAAKTLEAPKFSMSTIVSTAQRDDTLQRTSDGAHDAKPPISASVPNKPQHPSYQLFDSAGGDNEQSQPGVPGPAPQGYSETTHHGTQQTPLLPEQPEAPISTGLLQRPTPPIPRVKTARNWTPSHGQLRPTHSRYYSKSHPKSARETGDRALQMRSNMNAWVGNSHVSAVSQESLAALAEEPRSAQFKYRLHSLVNNNGTAEGDLQTQTPRSFVSTSWGFPAESDSYFGGQLEASRQLYDEQPRNVIDDSKMDARFATTINQDWQRTASTVLARTITMVPTEPLSKPTSVANMLRARRRAAQQPLKFNEFNNSLNSARARQSFRASTNWLGKQKAVYSMVRALHHQDTSAVHHPV